MTRIRFGSVLLLLTSLCLFPVILLANPSPDDLPRSFPQSALVPGGITTVDLGPVSDTPPVVHYYKKRVMVLPNNGRWQAIVGIPLWVKDDIQPLNVAGREQVITFNIRKKKYAEQRLTIRNKRKVNPNKIDMQRIRDERVRIRRALRHWQPQATVHTDFILPVKGRLSSPFGLRRFLNKQARSPHNGVDIAAPTGTPIVAPAAGRVIENGKFFFNGNSVFIDHGQGLITMYSHMSRIDVQPGQQVMQGDVIGTVGKTGRATGPHLHWSVSLNNARVDPALFFDDFKSLLASSKK